VTRQYELLNDEILPQLAPTASTCCATMTATRHSAPGSSNTSSSEVRPLLTPIGLDPAHPFPQVHNKSLNFIIELSGKDAFGAARPSSSSRRRACCRA
jgi:polyphosphate kinase